MSMTPEQLQELLLQFDAEFDERCAALAVNDGTKFMVRDTQDELMMELVNIGNIARYTFMKIRILQYRLSQEQAPQAPDLGFKKGM